MPEMKDKIFAVIDTNVIVSASVEDSYLVTGNIKYFPRKTICCHACRNGSYLGRLDFFCLRNGNVFVQQEGTVCDFPGICQFYMKLCNISEFFKVNFSG